MAVVGWIVGLLLIAMMAMPGAMKLIGHDKVKGDMARLGVSDGLMKFIGGAEVAAAIGVLIGLLGNGDNEWIGFLAAIGIIALMVGAIIYHNRAGDEPQESAPAAMAIALAMLYTIFAIFGS